MSAKPRRDSAKCAIVNRTVSFNIENEWEAQLERLVRDWTNFSGTVKRLIAASIPAPTSTPSASAPKPIPAETTNRVQNAYDPVADLL